MDAMSKELSINVARTLIYKLICESNIDTIVKFWIPQLDDLHLSENDSKVLVRILSLQSENDEISRTLYKNCISGCVINDLLKKNWRRFFNNNIIEKYYSYIKNEQFLSNKVWKMGLIENSISEKHNDNISLCDKIS